MLSLEGVIRSRYGLVKYGFDAMRAHTAKVGDQSVQLNQFSWSVKADKILEMNMGFEIYDGPLLGSRLLSRLAAVTITKRGQIFISKFLLDKYSLQKNTPIRFHFDSQRIMLAIEMIDQDINPHAFIRKSGSQTCYISAKSILDYYGLSFPTRNCTVTEEKVRGKKLMVIQLRKAECETAQA